MLYLDARPRNADLPVPAKLYGWVWSKSVSVQDGIFRFLTHENIRYRPNSVIVARLGKDASATLIYTNESAAWHLIEANVTIKPTTIELLDTRQATLWERLSLHRRVLSVSTRNKEKLVVYDLLEPAFAVVMLVVMTVLISARIAVGDAAIRGNIILEVLKSLLQVAVGLVLGFLIFGLGLKH